MNKTVTKTDSAPGIRSLITTEKAKAQIAAALPDHMTADRQVRVLLTALNKTPKLETCSPGSLIEAMMTCSELGLEPNGRDAYLIPYGSTATLVVGYQGLVELAYRSDRISNIETGVVRHGDEFDYHTCRHVPWEWRSLPRPESEGSVKGVFCVVAFKDGGHHYERMTFEQVEAIRNASKAGRSGPWVDHWDEMARKTVFRRASKWIPKSPHLMRAIENNDAVEGIQAASVDEPIDADAFAALIGTESKDEVTNVDA